MELAFGSKRIDSWEVSQLDNEMVVIIPWSPE